MRRSRRALLGSRRALSSCRAGGAARIASSTVSRRYRKTGHRKKSSREVGRGFGRASLFALSCGCGCRQAHFFRILPLFRISAFFGRGPFHIVFGSGECRAVAGHADGVPSARSALSAPCRSAIPLVADCCSHRRASSRKDSPSTPLVRGRLPPRRFAILLQTSQNRRSCIVKR